MSRIEAVEPFFLERPADAVNARAEHCFLLRIVTEDGCVGWGEGHGSPYIMRAVVDAPITHVSAQGLRHILRGAELTDVPALRRRMDRGTQWIGRDGAVVQAIAAAELALWDVAGKQAGLPVCRLLAERPAAQVHSYASGKVGATPELTHVRLIAEREAGFDAFKIGWPPFGGSEADDCAFLEAARDAVGSLPLMVDAAQAWDEDTALQRMHRFSRYRLGWLEEPLDRDDLLGQARLRATSLMPIAAGEGECGLRGLQALVEGRCVDVLQPDATRCGLVAAFKAGQMASVTGLRTTSHSFTTGLNVAVHLHLLAALADPGTLLEWPVRQLALWAHLFPDAPVAQQGWVSVPQTPGWGLCPDPDALRRYRFE